jgi:antitoxin component YwqK of YwqJK toxin-antitoxin module
MELRAEFKSGFSGTVSTLAPTPTESFTLKTGTRYYEGTKQISVEYTYYEKNGLEVLNGPSKGYYPTGELQYEANFKYGQQDGLDKQYYPNGQLSSETNWKLGFADGSAKRYYTNGQLSFECVYKDGKVVPGTEKNYNQDGTLRSSN